MIPGSQAARDISRVSGLASPDRLAAKRRLHSTKWDCCSLIQPLLSKKSEGNKQEQQRLRRGLISLCAPVCSRTGRPALDIRKSSRRWRKRILRAHTRTPVPREAWTSKAVRLANHPMNRRYLPFGNTSNKFALSDVVESEELLVGNSTEVCRLPARNEHLAI